MDTSINTKQTHGMDRSTQAHMQARKEQNKLNTKYPNLGNNWHARTQREGKPGPIHKAPTDRPRQTVTKRTNTKEADTKQEGQVR